MNDGWDRTPPSLPTGLSARVEKPDGLFRDIVVTWDRSLDPDFSNFEIEIWYENEGWVEGAVLDREYSLYADDGALHGFRVRTVDTAFNKSDWTEGLFITAEFGHTAALSDDVFRFYNPSTGAHFYTNSAAERDYVFDNLKQFQYEGNAFDAPLPGEADADVFRFYNSQTGTHFYTASVSERDSVIQSLEQYVYEGVGYQAYASDGGGRAELFRFYNEDTGVHFYTISEAERDGIVATLPQFNYEGVAYYVEFA